MKCLWKPLEGPRQPVEAGWLSVGVRGHWHGAPLKRQELHFPLKKHDCGFRQNDISEV